MSEKQQQTDSHIVNPHDVSMEAKPKAGDKGAEDDIDPLQALHLQQQMSAQKKD